MGLLRWLRGGDDEKTSTAALSAGLSEFGAIFQPTRHKQTEHVEATKRRKMDIGNGSGIDLERGIVMIRKPTADVEDATD